MDMSWKQSVVAQFHHPTGFWGRVAGTIMAHRPSNRERAVWTVSLLDIQRDDRVLEIGFGPGVAIQRAAAIATEGLIVGIDHSETMVRQAWKRNEKAIREGTVDLKRASVSNLPSFDGPFDKIFAINSMGFWEQPVERLEELRGLLRAGGLIAIAEQPRLPGATDQTAREAGERIVAALEQAGFARVRLEIKPMKPVAAICALGTKMKGTAN
jgi:ubiquinone/menaquinone biosynthesis C-methylase UbiE